MKKLILLFLLAVPFRLLAIHQYYVANSGSDSNAGTIGSPYATGAKAATVVVAGDTVYFNRGDKFAAFTANVAGTVSTLITWKSYGTGAQPLFSGFITASGWTSIGGGLYTYTDTNIGSTIPSIVTFNGINQPLGRTADSAYSAHSGTTSITNLKLPNSPSFTGGEVVIRKNHFIYSIGTVTGQSSGVITYTSSSTTTPTNGYNYFFQNNVNCLANLGDWMYNTSTHVFTMYFGANTPSSYTVKIGTATPLIFINSRAYNVFNGLSFEGAGFGIQGTFNASNTQILNCNFNNIGQNAIDFIIAHGLNFSKNTITTCNNDGITLYAATTGSNVKNNTLSNIGLFPGMAESDAGVNNEGSAVGISIADDGSSADTIQYNSVINVGFNAIQFAGNNMVIDRNYVNTGNTVKDDGAGIYTYGGYAGATHTGRVISNNIVLNCIGNIPNAPFELYEGHGIYLDGETDNLNCFNNTIAGSGGEGLFMNDPLYITCTNNLVYNNGINTNLANNANLRITYQDASLNGTNRHLNITGNTLVSPSNQYCFLLQSLSEGTSIYTELGTLNNNSYISLTASTTPIQTSFDETTSHNTPRTLSAWQGLTGQEASSTATNPANSGSRIDCNPVISSTFIQLPYLCTNVGGTLYTYFTLPSYTSVVSLVSNTGIGVFKVIGRKDSFSPL